MFISNNYASFHLWWKENLLKHQKVLKYYESGFSSGKSPCDGIAGTVKMLIACTSLQCPVNYQILSAKDMLKIIEDSISAIKFVYTPSQIIRSVRSVLVSRFSLAEVIPGTRGNHQFKPLTSSTIKMKYISHNNDFEFKFHFLKKKSHFSNAEVKDFQVSQYLLYRYNGLYWNGIVTEIDWAASDTKVKFMLPLYPSCSQRWPL